MSNTHEKCQENYASKQRSSEMAIHHHSPSANTHIAQTYTFLPNGVFAHFGSIADDKMAATLETMWHMQVKGARGGKEMTEVHQCLWPSDYSSPLLSEKSVPLMTTYKLILLTDTVWIFQQFVITISTKICKPQFQEIILGDSYSSLFLRCGHLIFVHFVKRYIRH